MTVNKRSIAAKKRIADRPKDYMAKLAKRRHAAKTASQRSAYGKMMAKAKKDKNAS